MNARHEEWVESAAAHALGALDAGERAAFESHLAGCAVCRTEVDAYAEVAAMLALAMPPVRPAGEARLRERIVREARLVRPIGTARREEVFRSASHRSTSVGWAVAAAAVVMAGFAGAVWRTQRAEMDVLRAELAVIRSAAAAGDSVVAALLGPEVHVVSLSRAGSEPAARVFWNHTSNQFIVMAFDLPPSPPGRTYQLWALPAGRAPLSMGTFDPGADGRVTAILPVSREITDAGLIDACGVTLEPAGGSPQPTEGPRLTGVWRHAD